MKTTKITIKNLFGIEETELNGDSVEITGKNGAGKTSVIDAIRYALTNKSDRDYIVKTGEREGEIIIETDTGLSISRKKRTDKSDYKSVKNGTQEIQAPETFLSTLFTPLQLNPVEFVQMSRQEQNRAILDLIEYKWDMQTIADWFGEVPDWVDYSKNILEVLHDIQAEDGGYFQKRQNINRDIRNKKAFIEDIRKDIPANYEANKWKDFDTSSKYTELLKAQDENGKIERAKAFISNHENKMRALEADRDIAISGIEKGIASDRESLTASIERMKAEIKAAEDKLSGLAETLENKKAVVVAEFEKNKTKLASDMDVAYEYANKPITPTEELRAEIDEAEAMKKHLNEYERMIGMVAEVEALTVCSDELTEKIELARELPGEILQTATLPVDNLTVEDGIPLVKGLPISNLSEGEQLELCVDVAAANPNALSLILLDGTEKLSEENREKLYAKCKANGLQFIATRTTNDNELMITTL